MLMTNDNEFTHDLTQHFEAGFRVGQAVCLGLSGRVDLSVMVQECAQACGADTFIYARYGRVPEDISFVAHSAVDAQDVAPSHKAMMLLRPGHLQTFGSQDVRYGLLVIGRTAHHLDLIIVSLSAMGVLKAMSKHLINAWHTRKGGVISAAMASCDDTDATAPILSPSNPCNLTRKEVQVCRHLLDGLKPNDLVDRMSCSMPTVRTHLRNIYAKTGLNGMVGVVHALHMESELPAAKEAA